MAGSKGGRHAPMTAARRAKLAKVQAEKIAVGYPGEHKDNAKKIQRVRLTKQNLDKSFGLDVDYIVDEFGEILFPKEWKYRCLPPPYYYTVHEKELVDLFPDEKKNKSYEGDTLVLVENVPLTCTSRELNVWIKFGLENLDERIVAAVKEVEEAKLELDKNQNRLDKVPYILNKESADAAAERKHMTKVLREQREELVKSLEEAERTLEILRNEKDQSKVDLEPISQDEKKKTATWKASFRLESDADQVVSFRNWLDVHLVKGDKHNPPIASAQDTDEVDEEMKINMRLVRFRRVRHGQGTLIENRDDMDKVLVYRGGWKLQQKHGQGILYTCAGRFAGTFECDIRTGKGEMRFANGDVYVGDWGNAANHKVDPILNSEQPMESTMHGKGEMRFNDGTIYRGDFFDGKITGNGVWENPTTGEKQSGEFLEGQLHGTGIQVTVTGDVLEGRFDQGVLQGIGKVKKYKGEELEGMFINGVLHGRGRLRFKESHVYEGCFENGLRHGAGTMHFGHVSLGFNDKSRKVELRSDHRYDGMWSGGKEQSRGMLATRNHEADTGKYGGAPERYFYTTNHKSQRVEFFGSLVYREQKRRAKENKRSLRRRRLDAEEHAKLDQKRVQAYRKRLQKALRLYRKIKHGIKDAKKYFSTKSTITSMSSRLSSKSLKTLSAGEYAGEEEEGSEYSEDYDDDYDGTSSSSGSGDEFESSIDPFQASRYMEYQLLEVGVDDVLDNFESFDSVTALEFLEKFKQNHANISTNLDEPSSLL